MKAILYARFSPRPNASDCDSCDSQLRDLRAWCERQGWTVAGEYRDDALSGADAERPGLWDAIASARRGDVFVVRNLNRLARDVMLALTIEQQLRNSGVQLASMEDGGQVKDDPTSELIRTILHAIAQYQRHLNNARTKARMRSHQDSGRRMSAIVPYGWQYDPESPPGKNGQPSRIIENDEEQAITKEILALSREGLSSYAIAKELNSKGVPCRGRRWHHGPVKRIVDRGRGGSQ